ncbi:hypothetical protein J6590_085346 [Homalodisca vitripennis]|nr:hypothetical protein J6590_085346 [Homalodisca vitripennis]
MEEEPVQGQNYKISCKHEHHSCFSVAETVMTLMSADIDAVTHWTWKHGLKLNVDKTQFITIGHPNVVRKTDFSTGQFLVSSSSVPGQFLVSSRSVPGQFQVSSRSVGQFQVSSGSSQFQFSSRSVPVQFQVVPGQFQVSSRFRQFQVSSRSVPGQFQVSSRSVPGQFQVSSSSVPGQFQFSSSSVPGQFQVSSSSVPGQFQVSSSSVPGQFQVSSRSVPVQFQISSRSVPVNFRDFDFSTKSLEFLMKESVFPTNGVKMSKRTLDNSLQGESRELMMGRRGMVGAAQDHATSPYSKQEVNKRVKFEDIED